MSTTCGSVGQLKRRQNHVDSRGMTHDATFEHTACCGWTLGRNDQASGIDDESSFIQHSHRRPMCSCLMAATSTQRSLLEHLQVHRLVGTMIAVILVLVSQCDGGATLQDPTNLYPPSVFDTNGDLARRWVYAVQWTRSFHQWLLDSYSLW